MKIITVVGARPNFMKAAPIIGAIRQHNDKIAQLENISEGSVETVQQLLVHTGQHYDKAMSDSFFEDLKMPPPDIQLGVGSASHAVQTAEIQIKFEQILLREQPDAVIVVGDVNSTIACALVTAKISFDAEGKRPLLAHVEAGLRSFDRLMPEEVNRVVTDHVSDLLFVTEESGVKNLVHEGISPEKIHLVGNTMIDSLLACKDRADTSDILERLALKQETNGNGASGAIKPYAVLTLHRPSNVDNPETLLNVLDGLEEFAQHTPIVFPMHPRTQRKVQEFGFERMFASNTNGTGGFVITNPLAYLEFLCLIKNARLVITDSGGIQEETTCLGVPCVTVRENTERPVTVNSGTNVLAGISKQGIRDAVWRQMGRIVPKVMPLNWDGKAAVRIVEVLVNENARRKGIAAADILCARACL